MIGGAVLVSELTGCVPFSQLRLLLVADMAILLDDIDQVERLKDITMQHE